MDQFDSHLTRIFYGTLQINMINQVNEIFKKTVWGVGATDLGLEISRVSTCTGSTFNVYHLAQTSLVS